MRTTATASRTRSCGCWSAPRPHAAWAQWHTNGLVKDFRLTSWRTHTTRCIVDSRAAKNERALDRDNYSSLQLRTVPGRGDRKRPGAKLPAAGNYSDRRRLDG